MSDVTITISTHQSAESSLAISNTFRFGDSSIRVITLNGEPWFAVSDVCDVLGYVNSRDALAKHCRAEGVVKRDTPMESDVAKRDTTSTARKNQTLTYINEGNLYRLIIKSRKPEAEKFESWVCDEVLPSIRKTGSYISAPPVTSPPITQRQYLVLRNALQRLANYAHNDNSAKGYLENALRIRLNVENLDKIPSHRYAEALQIVNQWADDSDNQLRPLLTELTDWWFHSHIAQNAPFTGDLKKQWKAKLQAALPQPLDWKKVHSVLEQLA